MDINGCPKGLLPGNPPGERFWDRVAGNCETIGKERRADGRQWEALASRAGEAFLFRMDTVIQMRDTVQGLYRVREKREQVRVAEGWIHEIEKYMTAVT